MQYRNADRPLDYTPLEPMPEPRVWLTETTATMLVVIIATIACVLVWA